MSSGIGKLVGFITAGLLMLALLPATAAAKTGLMLSPLPYGVAAGEPWEVNIQYIRADTVARPPTSDHPFIRVVSLDAKTTLDFPVHVTRTGKMRARVVFPRAGWWRYTVHGFGSPVNRQAWDPVLIATKRKAAHTATTNDPSSFPYGWVIAGGALALGAILTIRLRLARAT
jgi:hypothetical protein